MRIVVIGPWAPALISFRGPLLDELVARGHDVFAAAPDATPAVRDELARRGVTFLELGLQRAGTSVARDLRSIRELAVLLRRLAPGLVFTYAVKPTLYGAIAARFARIPHRIAMVTGLGYAFTPQRSLQGRAVTALVTGLYRQAFRACELVFFQNADDRDELRRRRVLPPDTPVTLVRGSGVDLVHYARAPLPQGPPRFLFVGRLLRDKGIYEFVAAARQLRARGVPASFAVLGWTDPNPESVTRAELDAWVTEGVIEYLGAVEDVRPQLREVHVLVLPSYREGTPRSVLEAMSTGRAVITTDAPGCRDTIVDGESGLMVPVRDAEALARAMTRLATDAALLVRLANSARQRVEALYDARVVAMTMADAMGL